MTAQLAAVAAAVADGLRDADFTPRGSVSLGYFAKRSLEESEIIVAVMPRKTRTERLTRGGLKQVDLDISVGVFRKLTGTDIEVDQQVDDMLDLCQGIEDYFETHALTGRTESQIAATTDANGDMNFDPESLLSKREFSAFLTLTFRGTRQAP